MKETYLKSLETFKREHEKFCTNKFENLDEIHKLWQKYNFLKLLKMK